MLDKFSRAVVGIVGGVLISFCSYSQFVPVHQSHFGIYNFIDELANSKLIEVSSVVKPYSRKQIYEFLEVAKSNENKLNLRQRKDLNFYLNEFSLEQGEQPANTHLNVLRNKKTLISLIDPAVRYNDSSTAIKLSPILGMNVLSNKHGEITQKWFGGDFFVSYKNRLSFYASLRDFSNEGEILALGERKLKIKSPFTKRDTIISQQGHISLRQGGAYKIFPNRGDYSEMRGGLYLTWKWGHVGIVKDHISFGDSYHGSNILSGRTPSFPMVKLFLKPTKFLEFSWFHGWLTSNVIDSSNFYQDNSGKKLYRYYNKYISSNMFTVTPVKHLKFSFGNSIIYAERNINIAYFIPFLFYKSVDHSLTMGTENQNSQLFLNISSRNIPNLHLYGSIFFDEIKWSRFSSSSKEKNPLSYKVGGRLTNWPIRNISATCEFTKNTIATYIHSIPALSYTSNGYNLGSYIGDNAKEFYSSISYNPLRGLLLEASYTNAKHGNQYAYLRADILDIISEPFMKNTVWSNTCYSFSIKYEVASNMYALLNVDLSNIEGFDNNSPLSKGEYFSKGQQYLDMYTPKYLQGKNTTVTIGFSFGF